MSYVRIEPVEDRAGRRAFVRFPEALYRGDPNWVAPLRREEEEKLSAANPFFDHAEARLFLARREGAVVGRVAAIVDRWHLERWKDGTGLFGFFESVNDEAVVQALFGAVRGWLRGKGLTGMRGPFNPSTNDTCGVLVDGFHLPPRIMMPYNPPSYPILLERVGLRSTRDLLTYELDVPAEMPPAIRRVAEMARGRGVQARALDPARLSEEVEVFRQVYNGSWSENWGFVPISEQEAAWSASQLKQVLVPDMALFAEVDGRPVGFFLCLPDLNPALRHFQGRITPWGLARFLLVRRRVEAVRLILLGVLPAYRRRGIEALLLARGWEAVHRLGYRVTEVGWILEDNAVTRQATDRWNARVVKKYRLYEASFGE
jgi:GNAT superfamily N-acetyltransferase